ncbi:MAG: hypothetical protein AAFR17_11890 [Pseudomonadota bacterium]
MMRFSAVPTGVLGDRKASWAIYGDRIGDPDGLEASAFAGVNLAQIAPVPAAPMFNRDSLFGMHLAGIDLELDKDAPVVVFVHGFCYEPRRPVAARIRSDNAHRCLYHFSDTADGPGSSEERDLHITPWFARAMLEEGRGAPEECGGLAVGYSFASYGGAPEPFLPSWSQRLRDRLGLINPFSHPSKAFENAYTDAGIAGCGLAAVLVQLRARLDHAGHADRPIDLLCHSLGARTVLTGLSMLAQRGDEDRTLARIDRVIMLSGACYWGQAADALANIRFARPEKSPQFYNFTSQHDDVLRHFRVRRTMEGPRRASVEMLGLERDEAPIIRRGKVTGWDGRPDYRLYSVFGPEYDDWIDIPLDDPEIRDWGRDMGMDLSGRRPGSLGDHWHSYTHPGNWDLYRKILHDRETWTVDNLRYALEG